MISQPVGCTPASLGRREQGADAICLVEVDGDVPAKVLDKVKAISVVRQVNALKF